MDQLDTAVKTLIDAIKDTQEYQCYQLNAKVVKKNTEMKAKVDELRSLSYMLQNIPKSDKTPEDEERLEEQFESLCEDSRVNDFMQAEIDFCRMFQDIMMQITQEINFE